MPKAYDKIPLVTLHAKSTFIHPAKPPEVIHLHDPATSVMINLAHTIAAVVSPQDHITDTLLVEKAGAEHVLFVVNEHNHIIGIITAEDIHGEKPYQIMQERRIKRSEISVQMVMTPSERVICFELENLKSAKVSNVIATFIETKHHYALVVEQDAKQSTHIVKGFFWASLISQGLGSDITSKDSGAKSLVELQREFRI